MTEPLMTSAEAAAYLNCSLKSLYHRIERGYVPARRLGRDLRFSRASLDAALDDEQRRRARAGQRGYTVRHTSQPIQARPFPASRLNRPR